MRNILSLIICTFIMFSPVAVAQKAFTVSGTIEGLSDTMKVALVDFDAPQDKRDLGEGAITGNTFSIQASVPSTHMCGLSVMAMHPLFQAMFPILTVQFVADGSDVTVSSPLAIDSLKNLPRDVQKELIIDVKGGKEQEHYLEYLRCVKDASQEESRLNAEWAMETMTHFGDYSFTTPKEDSLKALHDVAQAKVDAQTDEFVRQHPDYFISANIVKGAIAPVFAMTADKYRAKAATVSPADPDVASALQATLDNSVKYALETPWTDFEGTTPEGEQKSVSSLRKAGHYLLMDFWASWCGPCRKAIPRVKKILAENADRLDVISIDVDQKEADWRKALEEEGMTWPQLRIAGPEAEKAFKAYVIETIPRLVLVSPDGKIKTVTHDPSLIDETLKSNK